VAWLDDEVMLEEVVVVEEELEDGVGGEMAESVATGAAVGETVVTSEVVVEESAVSAALAVPS
jgi:hypothetical protein